VGHDVVDGDASEPVEQNPVRQDWIVFPAGEGVTDKFIRSKDWSKTPLGPIEFWPQSLRTTVSLALASQSPSNVIWGPQRIQLYNPAYRSILGDEMAQDIGRDYLQCWSWMREPLEHAFVNARAGEAAEVTAQRLFLPRHGRPEETFFNFAFSPIRDEAGEVGGVFLTLTEQTQPSLYERRSQILRELATRRATADSLEAACDAIAQTLDAHPLDLPFSLLYLLDAGNRHARLARRTGLPEEAVATLRHIDLEASSDSHWPLEQVMHQDQVLALEDLAQRFGTLACGPYQEPPQSAVLLPIHLPGRQRLLGFLVAGVSARRPLDAPYQAFYRTLREALEHTFIHALAAAGQASPDLDSVSSSGFSHPFPEAADAAINEWPGIPGLADRADRRVSVQQPLIEAGYRARVLVGAEELSEGLYLVDRNGAFIDANPSGCRLLGSTREELLECGLEDVLVADERPRWVMQQRRCTEGAPLRGAWRFRRRHGALFVGGVTAFRLPDGSLQCIVRDLSEFQNARSAKLQLAAIVESSTDAIVSKTLQGVVTSWNGGAEDLFGYQADEMLGRSIRRLIPDQRQSEEDHILARIRAGERIVKYETVRRCKDGRLIHVSLSISPIHDESGEIIGVSKIAQDITEYKQTEAALRASEEKYRTLFDSIDEGFCIIEVVFDLHGNPVDYRFLEVNAAFERQTGLSDAAGKSARELVPDLEPHWVEAYGRIDRTRQAERFELEAGSIGRYYEVYAFPVGDEQAHQVSILFKDIWPRKAAERALRENEQRLRLAMQAARAGSWEAIPATGEFTASDLALKLHGLPPGTPMDHVRAMAAVHTEDRPRVEAAVRHTLATGEPFRLELRVPQADGSMRWVATHAELLSDGEHPRLVGLVQDITDIKHTEQALREQDQRKDVFLATLAHELRNPLAPVRNALELIKRAGDDAELMRESLSMIERQINHMVRLIDDLLDVSRITLDKLELQREQVELQSILEHAVEACEPNIQRAAQVLEIEMPKTPVWLDVDPVRLTQVIGNLLTNACKYTPHGGRIRLTATREGDQVRIRVKDTGVGIPADKLTRVFDLFTQMNRSFEGSQGGLGIGLSLAKRLVEMHGGSITADSAGAGLGSEMTVLLPVLNEAPKIKRKTKRNKVSNRAKPRRLLIVDDNRDHADALTRLFRLTGNEVQTAYDGMQAVEIAERFGPDVVLLDLSMPNMDGFEACRRIRNQSRGGQITMIALSGWGQERDRHASKAAGFDAHLTKPVGYAAIMQLLDGLAVD